MATKSSLSPKQRDELRAYLNDAALFAGLKAQSYDPKGSASCPEDDGISDRQLSLGRAHARAHAALGHVEAASDEGPVHRGVLSLSYGPLALDDRHESRHDREISALLRMTDAVQQEAARRWILAERERLVSRGANPDGLFVLPPSPAALRPLATAIIGEARKPIMYGDEHTVGALTQARTMLDAAEVAYLVALRIEERGAKEWVDDERVIELPMRHPVEIDPCLQRARERAWRLAVAEARR